MLSALKVAFLPRRQPAAPTPSGEARPAYNRRASDRPLTVAEIRRMYTRPRSFCDKLPWLEYLPESRCFLLEDGVSVGAVYDLVPIGTEGRSQDFLKQIRDGLEAALQNVFEEYDDKDGPWVVQLYAYDEYDLDAFLELLTDYVRPAARGSQFTAAFLETMRAHLRGVSQAGGLFEDKSVTGGPWQGKWRRAKLVIYRRRGKHWLHPGGLGAQAELDDVCERFEQALQPVGALLRRNTGKDFYGWLLRWFNPNPPMTEGDARAFYACAAYPGDEDLPFGHDFTESLLYCWPQSDLKTQTWWFDGWPHRCLSVQKLRSAPKVGHTTGELAQGKAIYALFDKLPEHTIMALTLIITPQDVLENHFNELDRRAVGETLESEATRRDIVTAKATMQSGHKLYRGNLAFYTRGRDLTELRKNTQLIASVLNNHGIQPVKESDEQVALDAYLLNLPMNFDPALDQHTQCARFLYAQHAANLAPVYGRCAGTGNPGIAFFNRGGSPLTFDPLSLKDRRKNGHMLLLGPTGAGKSATLTSIMMQLMALVRPRLFIIEAGNSFGLLADYFAAQGLSVHKVQLKAGAGVSLPPFADAHKLLDKRQLELEHGLDLKLDELAKEDSENDEQRDLMGEMEIIAMLMITGGEEKEAAAMTRADRRMLRDAILAAAKTTFLAGRQCLTGDVREALYALSRDASLPEERRSRAYAMADAMGLFCDGLEGELFNRPGEAWPECDVTLIDLATYAREGYGGQLAVAYTSLMTRINNLAEKYQYDERPLVKITDEAHIITTNPLLAAFIVKIVKMWRKLGAWYWAATQNLKDFPNAAEKLLNMIEWWILLVMEKDEVEQIARFRDLTPEQKALLLSARKEPGKYTEGVVLAAGIEALFRNVPPSLSLALAMTEKDEKVERRKLMDQFGISEVEAALRVAQALDRQRGIAA